MKATHEVAMNKHCLIYLRVSTGAQAAFGIGLPAQETRIRDYCTANGYEVLQTFVESGVSGKRMVNRPALLKCIERATKEHLPVITYSLHIPRIVTGDSTGS